MLATIFFFFFFFSLNCKIHQYRIEYNNIITYKTSYNLYSKVQLNLLTIFSYQFLVNLVKWFQRKRLFRNRPIRNKNCLWRPCLVTDRYQASVTDRYQMSNLYRGPSIDASYAVWFIWSSSFRGEDFLEINQSEIRIACGGHVC
jgi:hypothetical protein